MGFAKSAENKKMYQNNLLAYQQSVNESKTIPRQSEGLHLFLRRAIFSWNNVERNNGSCG